MRLPRLLRSVDTIILQFEIPLETIYHTVRFARAHGIRCIVNPAPALPANLAELAAADYFIPNETEAELHHRAAGAHRRGGAQLRRGAAAEGIPSAWCSRSARAARCSPPRARARHVPPFAVTAVDTTGAGDAFIGSLAVFLAEGRPRRMPWRARTSTRPCRPPASARRNHFRGATEFEAEWARRSRQPN